MSPLYYTFVDEQEGYMNNLEQKISQIRSDLEEKGRKQMSKDVECAKVFFRGYECGLNDALDMVTFLENEIEKEIGNVE